MSCTCTAIHQRRRVVLTGGPGAGKTAVLELIRQSFCEHVKVLPEAAGIVFGGGFPRESEPTVRRAAQRAIFHVECELENAGDARNPAVVLCDRGTLDCLAYWPGAAEEWWAALQTTYDEQLERYDAVIHLRVPPAEHGYNYSNPLRTESAADAAAIDARILEVWQPHPRRFVIPSSPDFFDKASQAVTILRAEMPPCCRDYLRPAPGRQHTATTAGARD